jgi:hypothetical protein
VLRKFARARFSATPAPGSGNAQSMGARA